MPKNPKTPLDARVNLMRADLAADYLRGKIDVPKFVTGEDMMVISPSADLFRHPEGGSSGSGGAGSGGAGRAQNKMRLDSQLLHGEIFKVYEQKNGWAWGQSADDNYVGYIQLENLGAGFMTDMCVSALRGFIYPEPDIKSRPPITPNEALSMGARVKMIEQQGRFVRIQNAAGDGWGSGDSWMIGEHLVAKTSFAEDYVAVAEQFINAPYLWGGRQSVGLDCSALVQIALMRAGIAAPRDADMQEKSVGVAGESVPPAQYDALQRGDLVFWHGHVGILRDANTLLHANATHMKTVSEDFKTACARIAKTDGEITSILRMPAISVLKHQRPLSFPEICL